MKLFDVHTHLSSPDFDEHRDAILKRALEICDYLVDIGSGTSPDAFIRAQKLAEAHASVFFTAGIHPHDAEVLGSKKDVLKEIESAIQHEKCVAIGECGLDYYYGHSPRETQKEIFKWHIDLAQKTGLPLMIHTRDAESDTKGLLQDYSGKGLFHCFTGSKELAAFGVGKGFLISFSGIVTFKNASDLRDVFLSVPLDHVVVETDAPFLAPVPMRGKKNEPSFIEHTARFLADLRKISFEEFQNKTTENALRFFSKIDQPTHPT